MFDHRERRRRLDERMEAEDVQVLFLAPSADLEYLTGVERQIPHFGEIAYAMEPRMMIERTLIIRSTRVIASASVCGTP